MGPMIELSKLMARFTPVVVAPESWLGCDGSERDSAQRGCEKSQRRRRRTKLASCVLSTASKHQRKLFVTLLPSANSQRKQPNPSTLLGVTISNSTNFPSRFPPNTNISG